MDITKTQQYLDKLGHLGDKDKLQALQKFAINTELILRKLHQMYKMAIEDAMSYGPSEIDNEYVDLDGMLDEYLKT